MKNYYLTNAMHPKNVIIVNNRQYAALHHFAPVLGFAGSSDAVGTKTW